MVIEHLNATQQFEKKGVRRPLLVLGDYSFSIQHGQYYISEMENGTFSSVQIKEEDSNLPESFVNKFFNYKTEGLGYCRVPVKELDKFLQSIAPQPEEKQEDEKDEPATDQQETLSQDTLSSEEGDDETVPAPSLRDTAPE